MTINSTELAQSVKRRVCEGLYVKADDILELVDALEKAQQTINEMDGRTIIVKLPPKVDVSNVPFAGHAWNCCLDEVEKRLAALAYVGFGEG